MKTSRFSTRCRIVLFLSALFSVLSFCRAEDIVLTSTSATHPYERGQWTAEQCAAWQEEYGPIRGINCPYPPCGAMTQEQAIAYAASLGYNSVRWWPSGGTNADNYIKAVEQWAGWADKYGMTVSPVFGFPQSYFSQSDHASALKNLENQVRKIIRHFRGDKRIILWDLWNEPNLNDGDTKEMMEWITKMVTWCQQEGCTQAITSSLVWDGGVSTNQAAASGGRLLRENVEKLMDVHNYHDYSCQDGFNNETSTMYARLKKISDRPIVCTECMTRTNGSTYARTLIDFAKYNINFYTWGLSACDPNWEVRWSRSTFYNWDPMFHNALYADMEPYNESEPQWVKNYQFQGDFGGAKTGAEYTEIWSSRRAWKWMQHGESKGLYCKTIAEAITKVNSQKRDKLYNTIAVRINYASWASSNSAAKTQFNSLLSAAESAGMTVIPILLTSENLRSNVNTLATYAFNFINEYYYDRRIQAWCILEQTDAIGNEASFKSNLETILRKARYAFQNQPLFCAPLVTEGVTPDSTQADVANLMWQLSDVCGFSASDASTEFLERMMKHYHRPIFLLGNNSLTEGMQDNHVNWATAAALPSEDVSNYHFSTFLDNNEDRSSRWPGWKAWRWMNRPPTRGLSFSNISNAISMLENLNGTGSPYNSISVALDFRGYRSSQETFFADLENLLTLAAENGMTVLPQLLSDTYFRMSAYALTEYVENVLTRYANDTRILAWDLYNKLSSVNSNPTKAESIIDDLFKTARATGAQQPIFMTPSVSVNTFPNGFDPIASLVHGRYDGWSRLTYGSGSVDLCYRIWCMSDVICYTSSQTSPYLGWLNAQAAKFGRPLFCAEWKVPTSEAPSATMEIFKDMHISWFANGTLDEEMVRDFTYRPVSTQH